MNASSMLNTCKFNGNFLVANGWVYAKFYLSVQNKSYFGKLNAEYILKVAFIKHSAER
jgi:hypothetical protein